MAVPTSAGGHVVSGSGSPVTVENSMWSGDFGGRKADVTTSGSGGGARYAAVIHDPAFEVEIPWDSVDYPTAIGWTFGSQVALIYLLIGASGKAVKVENTFCDGAGFVNDPKADVPRVRARFSGGVATLDVTAPS